jgi:lantibiotic modifying enzyme
MENENSASVFPIVLSEDSNVRSAAWLATGLQLAHEVAAAAVWADGVCAFHGATPAVSLTDPPRYRSLGADLYEGAAGIARFLGWAASLSGDTQLRTTALAAIRYALETTTGWSLFTGAMGVGVATLELAEVLEAPALVPMATRCIERASEEAVRFGEPYDFLVGTAGVIVGLAAVDRYDLDGSWLARAQALGQGLLAAAIPDGPEDEDGMPLSWALAPGMSERLCGLAHGATGMALAFEALARLVPDDPRWLSSARRARAFERGHYSASEGSWADLRTMEPATELPPYPHMWCHGSIGVTAERLDADVGDLLARADAVGGLAGVASQAKRLLVSPVGPGADDGLNGSLCHGLCGAIDLFTDAWQKSGDTGWFALAADLTDLMLNDVRRVGGWRSGIRGGWPTPGLMLGESGMGWTLLRVAVPGRVPSAWRCWPAR